MVALEGGTQQVQRQLQDREVQLQTLRMKATFYEGTIEELRSQLQSKDAKRETQEMQRIELSQCPGAAEEQSK